MLGARARRKDWDMADRHPVDTTSAFTTIARVGPTQQVREQLYAAIERGDYQPGSMLPSERVLCETFGVSRVSVREAIAGLEATGLIVVQHGRGAFVRDTVGDQYAGPFAKYIEIHRDEIVELLKVRGALDELAAEEAALRGTPDGLAGVMSAHEAFHTAAHGVSDPTTLAALDVAFHLSIAAASGGALLSSLLKELNGILDDSRRLMLGRPGQTVRSAEQHQAIVDAILSGNTKAARRAVERHLSGVRDWVQQFVPTEPSNGPTNGAKPAATRRRKAAVPKPSSAVPKPSS
jgi:GntR family transcriptional repressor for pyruvate dehydrogenase complex